MCTTLQMYISFLKVVWRLQVDIFLIDRHLKFCYIDTKHAWKLFLGWHQTCMERLALTLSRLTVYMHGSADRTRGIRDREDGYLCAGRQPGSRCCQNHLRGRNWFQGLILVLVLVSCCQNGKIFTLIVLVSCCQNGKIFTLTVLVSCCQNGKIFTLIVLVSCFLFLLLEWKMVTLIVLVSCSCSCCWKWL